MDKSETEILAGWDLVSSVSDTEPENSISEKKADTETSNNRSIDVTVENKSASREEMSDTAVVDSEKQRDINSAETAEREIVNITVNTVEADIKEETEPCSGLAEVDVEEIAEADTEETSEPDTEEITVIETIMYDVKKITEIDSEKAIEANVEKINYTDIEGAGDNIKKTDSDNSKTSNETKDSCDAKSDFDKTDVVNEDTAAIISDNAESGSFDCSMDFDQFQLKQNSRPDVLQFLSGPTYSCSVTEQENASIESSSSDIDIIDENVEESITSSYVQPLSLSISSSTDTSNNLSSSENIKSEDVRKCEKSESHVKSEVYPKTSEVFVKTSESQHEYQRSPGEMGENVHYESHRPHQQSHPNMINSIMQFLRQMNFFEWSLVGTLVISLCLTIVFNQTNIFAVEKENVMFQMIKMIDDLKYDNKLLKDQMLSEMKNEKVLSSFEHQIKELRKENSRLNHMLYDVAKVLEKQQDSHEKKEAEYLAPFKKEINKLKEHINILKFDNEELQKQLVRMRYASYSQGGKDTSDDKSKEQKEKIKNEEANSADEIPLDINSLKKWNELISLLSKELSLSLENEGKEKHFSETKRNIIWYWKIFLQDFKGTFEDFKANITSRISDYKKRHENTVSDLYKFVKKFFTVEKNQQFVPHGASSTHDDSQWENIGDFFNDLKDKWTNIKNRIDTSDLRNFFKDFKMFGNAETSQHGSKETKTSAYEYDRKPTNVHSEPDSTPSNVHFDSQKKPDIHFESERKFDKVQSNSEDSKWMFDRAASREELRSVEKEDDSVNWFLKKKHLSKDEVEKK